jgi:hypothetical protein
MAAEHHHGPYQLVVMFRTTRHSCARQRGTTTTAWCCRGFGPRSWPCWRAYNTGAGEDVGPWSPPSPTPSSVAARGHVYLALQTNPRAPPALLVELAAYSTGTASRVSSSSAAAAIDSVAALRPPPRMCFHAPPPARGDEGNQSLSSPSPPPDRRCARKLRRAPPPSALFLVRKRERVERERRLTCGPASTWQPSQQNRLRKPSDGKK